jgi:hypothetical protein
MNHYVIPGCRRKLHTAATRRWLVVSVMDGRAKVEASTDDENQAASLLARYRREFAPRCTLMLLDQTGLGGS